MQMLTRQLPKIRLISILKDNLIDFCKWQSCTPGSNLTYLAPQDNFSLVPNYFLGPPEHDKMFQNINSFGFMKMHGSMATHNVILMDAGVHTNAIYVS